jgi:peroxiredoxin Q/BCP
MPISRRMLMPRLALALGLASAAPISLASGDAPAVGAVAPAFKLQDQNGAWHTLEEYRGKWVVLYFYPKDQTPGCTAEACDARDNIAGFRKAGAVVLGVSVDDVASHKNFAEQNSLPFTLLSDNSKQTAANYGVLVKMLGIFELAQRDTFIIDPQGRVAKHWVKVDPKGHAEMVLKELTALQAAAAHSTPPASTGG